MSGALDYFQYRIDELIDYDYSEAMFHKRLKKELLLLKIEEEEK